VSGKVRAAAFAAAVVAAGLAVAGDVNAFAAQGQEPVAATPTPLDGTYRVDVLGSRGTFDGQPHPHGDAVRWYSIRSTCTEVRCTAQATQLDAADLHLRHPLGHDLEFTFERGRWMGTPFTDTSPCLALPEAEVPLSVTWVLSPEPDGTLIGTRAITELDRGPGVCGGGGGVHEDPLVLTRVDAANGKGREPA